MCILAPASLQHLKTESDTGHQRKPPHISSLCLLSRSAAGALQFILQRAGRDGGFTQLSTGIEVTVAGTLTGRGDEGAPWILPLCKGRGLSSTGDLASAEHNAPPFSHSSHKT
ncbi:hypothetical protein PBY51_015764 [Eleginops maclovinus]|uniref:Uncharacterized protein n=1 Tax=Eleginops maclovinus TaxID=56733 RepID=A0AAN7XPC0_ELEMC|nr:hypothetical protein PBY51_015764 [Eleginops maclovinus]